MWLLYPTASNVSSCSRTNRQKYWLFKTILVSCMLCQPELHHKSVVLFSSLGGFSSNGQSSVSVICPHHPCRSARTILRDPLRTMSTLLLRYPSALCVLIHTVANTWLITGDRWTCSIHLPSQTEWSKQRGWSLWHIKQRLCPVLAEEWPCEIIEFHTLHTQLAATVQLMLSLHLIAQEDNHYKRQFDLKDTWSLKYNMLYHVSMWPQSTEHTYWCCHYWTESAGVKTLPTVCIGDGHGLLSEKDEQGME